MGKAMGGSEARYAVSRARHRAPEYTPPLPRGKTVPFTQEGGSPTDARHLAVGIGIGSRKAQSPSEVQPNEGDCEGDPRCGCRQRGDRPNRAGRPPLPCVCWHSGKTAATGGGTGRGD